MEWRSEENFEVYPRYLFNIQRLEQAEDDTSNYGPLCAGNR